MSELPHLPLNKATRFRNAANGYEESILWLGWLWCLLFGPVYFAVKGVWTHAFGMLAFTIMSFGIAWFVYSNYRARLWAPTFQQLNLPPVTPHSARHSFISTLQAQGIEVGLVAKLAGHASVTVTLGHYTQAVRGGEGAVAALERAYGAA